MKKGKQNHSNIIAVTALSLLCVGILGGAFLLNRSPEPVFEPAASEPAAASLPKETEAPTRELLEGTPDDEIQVVESEGDEVEIALTPPVTKPAREIPETQSQPAKSCPDKPTQAPTEAAPDTEGQEAAAPSADSNEHEGQVYDPVFGWTTPGAPQADILDNDGDVNKQIGYIE